MMLPCTASTMAGQLFTDGSLILQRSRRLSSRGAHPVEDLAAPAFDGAEGAAAGRHGLRRSAVRRLPAGRGRRPRRIREGLAALRRRAPACGAGHRPPDRPARGRGSGRRRRRDGRGGHRDRRRKRGRRRRRFPGPWRFRDAECRCAPDGRGWNRTTGRARPESRIPARPGSTVSRSRSRCAGGQSRRTPPTQTMPRSSRLPVKPSLRRSTISRRRPACALAMTKPTSVAMAPMSAM